MREIRVFVDVPLDTGRDLRLPDAAAAHVQRVLRLRPGAELTLFNGRGGEYVATLLRADRDACTLRVDAFDAVERESPLRITLAQGVSRGERMDVIVQKATELGVTRIQPLLTERSVVKLDADAAAKRRAHWQAIAASACEQCGRNRLPVVDAPLDYDRWLATLPPGAGIDTGAAVSASRRIVLAPGATQSLATLARAATPDTDWLLLIGPEGGLGATEVRDAQSRGFIATALGPRVLRTETAPLAALTTLQALCGDLG